MINSARPDEGSLSAETEPSPVTNAHLALAPPSPTRGEGKEADACDLKRRRQFLCAWRTAVGVHPAVGDGKQPRHGVVADCLRVAAGAGAVGGIGGRGVL